MPQLVKYGLLSSTTNSMAGDLVKAQCVLCGRKFGSIDEAKLCEVKHFQSAIKDALQKHGAKMNGKEG